MKHNPRNPGRRAVAVAELFALVAFAGFVALSGRVRGVSVAVMIVASAAVVVLAAVQLWFTRQGATPIVVAAVAALGLVGACAYLWSLRDVPAAIPIAGVGVLMLALPALFVTAVVLAVDKPPTSTNA